MELSKEEQLQYDRHLILKEIGNIGQSKLKKSSVLVIGAGGLGCAILQYLTAAGVGTIGIIDNDVIDQSNLQRQILFTHEDIGHNKAVIAARRLHKLNPYIAINVYEDYLSATNALSLFKRYDIIVDGSDNFPTRYLVNDAAVLTDRPVVFGSIFKFAGQVAVFNYKKSATYRCLYPTPPEKGAVPNCSDIGVLGVLPGIIGSLQANEALKLILGIGKPLTGSLLIFDALTMQQSVFSFEKNDEIMVTSLSQDYEGFCGMPAAINEIDFQTFQDNLSTFNVLDVRNSDEREQYKIKSVHIPLHELSERMEELPVDKDLLVYCKSGIRSKAAIQLLKDNNYGRPLINLKGGLKIYDGAML